MLTVVRARTWVALVVVALAGFAAAAGCGNSGNGNSFKPVGMDASAPGDATMDTSATADSGGDSAANDSPSLLEDAGPTTLAISPAMPTASATLTNGVLATTPVQLKALATNLEGTVTAAASWSFDRGELGSIDATTGIFTATGNLGGIGNVTAKWDGLTATVPLAVSVLSVQNGGSGGLDGGAEAGAGGIGGVGGSGPGGPVSTGTQTILTGTATAPASPAELGWLYPYDQTVWPRGLLPPLLQWQTTHTVAGVFIHMTEQNYEFQGFYAGSALVNQPVDATAWQQATYGNGGDKLHVEITVTDGTTAWGPIAEDWIIAAGVLQGTVYYGSYNSQLAGTSNGAVLAIQPGATAPNIAIPGTGGTCNVCHSVSADGSTLFMQNDTTAVGYWNGSSYNLTDGGTVIATYTGDASDGTTNNRKFLWSAPYPDGTFAMASSEYTREAYPGASLLFKRSDATQIATTGWTTSVTSAVTPIFSTDGRTIAFNYWTGTATNAVDPGAGHNLVAMDFDCGAGDGGTTCGTPPYSFANLRQLYSDTSRYPGWPAFLPDATGLVFHNTLVPGNEGPNCGAGGSGNCWLTTWAGAQAEIWWTNVPAATSTTPPAPLRLDGLNGLNAGTSYLPTNTNHPNDTVLNYEPTVNPIASGGYYWVVFTSRRMYGNVAAGDPYDTGNGTYPIPKKLWVAAVNIGGTPGQDISHPAFYLPGQELNAGNLRGYWVVNPCKQNGNSCLTGDECCNGFCRDGDAGQLECTSQPPGCSNEYEKCASTADCCGAPQGFQCLNGLCASPGPQ
jgi:hypothetical protein